MKEKLILINWLLSFMATGMLDFEHSSLTGVIAIPIWFAYSSFLLKYAERRGLMDKIVKRLKMDEL